MRFEELYTKVIEKNGKTVTFDSNHVISVARMQWSPTVKQFDAEYAKTYNVFRVGDIAFEGNRSGGFAYGRFVANDLGNGIVSHVFDVFRPVNEAQQDAVYMRYFIHNENVMRDVLRKSTTRATMMNSLDMPSLNHQLLHVPGLEEQQRIASLLSSVDETITLCQRKLDLLTQAKKALMQQIFSQKLRFKADDGSDFPEWEKKRLDKTGTFYGGLSGKSSSDFTNGNAQFLTYMNVYKNAFARQDLTSSVKISEKESPNHVEYGDILFTQSSETVEEVGLSSVYLFKDRPYLNSFCMGFRPNSLSELDPRYMGYCMRSEPVRRQIMVEGQGISRINIAASRLGTIKFLLPALPEQQKIASCLSSADALIDQARVELEQWQEVKKSLLQQMFA